jgi:cell division protein FtsL
MTQKKKKTSLSYILGGKILTEDFVIKQSGLFLLIFFLVLLFITNRYHCSKKLSEMDKLKKELVDLNHEQVFLTTRLTAISRQSQIEELLREKRIELKKRNNTTIYHIHK